MVLQNLARTKSIRAGLYSTTIYWKGSLPEPVAQGGVEYICSTYTSAVARLPHFPGILYYSRSGKIWSARYIGAVAYI